jgi:hypothetical protein
MEVSSGTLLLNNVYANGGQVTYFLGQHCRSVGICLIFCGTSLTFDPQAWQKLWQMSMAKTKAALPPMAVPLLGFLTCMILELVE